MESEERPHKQHVMGPLITGSEHKHEYIHFTFDTEFCVNPHHTNSCPAAGGTREEVLAFCCQAGLWKDEGEGEHGCLLTDGAATSRRQNPPTEGI